MNVLWIMADQLRWDYLSCYGARHIETPHLDALAARGLRFERAYVQSPVCGPSRMSAYTGRYVRSHGASWNGFPLRVGEPTLGAHLRAHGVPSWLIGKTHMTPDREGMARLGIEPDTIIGAREAECGFDVVVRDDGTNHSDYPSRHAEDYDAHLRAHGMDGENPWEEWANTGVRPDGSLASGWLLENSRLPARVPAEHSETAWLTTRAIEFMEAAEGPWLAHVSYIKPHWPYLAPAPYNDMYAPSDLPPPNRSEAERGTDHPVLRAWQEMRVCRSFSRDAVREATGPAYMGLVKQLDDEMGRLFAAMDRLGLTDETMVVFCSDHGENLGDHWLGEKDLFYDCAARVPLIVADPRPEADPSRGASDARLVEMIDLAPTFAEALGAPALPHVHEGRSLGPLLRGEAPAWRGAAISEYDYATRGARLALGVPQEDARLVMVFDGRWKYVHAEGFRPMLWDLQTDPDELREIGADPAHAGVIARLAERHFEWARGHHARITLTPERIEAMAQAGEPPGIYIGYLDEDELARDGRSLNLRRNEDHQGG